MKAMLKVLIAAFLATIIISSTAEARRHNAYSNNGYGYSKHRAVHKKYSRNHNTKRKIRYDNTGIEGAGRARMVGDTSRPGKWCGWWMRTIFGGGPEYNRAAQWARRGSAASPHVGAVVVWPHHVGMITGRAPNGQWIVKSGNDGGRVRERARSVSGAIAFRSI